MAEFIHATTATAGARLIEFESTDYGFGTVISGPSKNADIEQALVYGTQAARGVTVMLMP